MVRLYEKSSEVLQRVIPVTSVSPWSSGFWGEMILSAAQSATKKRGMTTTMTPTDVKTKDDLSEQDKYIIADNIRHSETKAKEKAQAEIWELMQWGGWFFMAVIALAVIMYFVFKHNKYFKKLVQGRISSTQAVPAASEVPLCLLKPYTSRINQDLNKD